MVEFIIDIVLSIIIWGIILNIRGNRGSGGRKFGDGNGRYDFKDYVNNKADREVQKRNNYK